MTYFAQRIVSQLKHSLYCVNCVFGTNILVFSILSISVQDEPTLKDPEFQLQVTLCARGENRLKQTE